MKHSFHIAIAALSALLSLPTQLALAQTAAEPRQDLAVLKQTAEQFLRTQATGLPGEVQVTVGAIDPRMKLPACTVPEGFLPPASKAWGKTTVGIRCNAPSAWTIYVSAQVRVHGEYIAAAAPLAQGQTITQGDIAKVKGDLTNLPSGVITDASLAIGRTAATTISLGSPLRQDALRNQQAIQQGQAVRVVFNGDGFSVSSEARALNNANEGQLTQVRTPAGQVVSGIAKLGGIVELTY
ncbi:flagellar basal body P-ring formation chaperone FlgA [Herminiimonas arsenitoxidans]|uniref:flagellar basal body P-ring formation chaperone FlgA n=1 Tax=Herminiimonas arsenitoxidans TaxID=1809410 RepID=UPI0009702AD0|nr:flagellar basal body P-ring formation chaperone FlgA [Herminiimonas arsenitoxidans]